MIISLSREEDKKTLSGILDILETTTRYYLRTNDEKILEEIQWINGWYDSFKEKIEKSDYTVEDSRKTRIDLLLKKLYEKNL